jgi:arabinofuranosyltransferase
MNHKSEERSGLRRGIAILIILLIFVAQCLSLNFTQDDAFISYRYVDNFLQGNGLVFNSGERVEGYTNFLWIIVLSIFARLGLNIIVVSKILGVASGCATLVLLYQLSRMFFPKREWLLPLLPPLLLAATSAFAYWSISGLETSLFVMMVLLSIRLYLTRPMLWVISCAGSTLVRPEGALIFGILLLHHAVSKKGELKKALNQAGVFALLLLPFAIFKLTYYGDLLPNPFYAKTGLSIEYLQSGFEYFWQFLKHHGLWGFIYLLPLLLYRGLDSRSRLLLLLSCVYTLYIIVVGGDVLKVHRFFLPILPALYLLLVICADQVFTWIKDPVKKRVVLVFVLLSISALYFLLPRRWIADARGAEEGLVEKMEFTAEYLNEHHPERFTIALPTIGTLSYLLGDRAQVIDMLGLVDKYIPRHPENIEGIGATWKERKYNSRYVLSRDPDFILFSTGYKPSAPAERALFLHSKFRQNYFVLPVMKDAVTYVPAYKKKGEYSGKDELFKDSRFVDLFYEAVSLSMRGRYMAAIDKMNEVLSAGPKDFGLPYELIGMYYTELQDFQRAERYLKKALEVDDHTVFAHMYLVSIYKMQGRDEEAEQERSKVYLYDPNFPW